MRFLFRIIFSLLFLFQINSSTAQVTDSIPPNTISVSFTENSGITKQHYSFFPKPSPAFVSEISVLWQTRGKRYWHSCFNFPEAGLQFVEGFFGNAKYNVQNFSLVPVLVFRKKNDKSFGKEIKIGTGFGYFTNPNHNPTGTENILLGSHVTNLTTGSFSVWKAISSSVRINAGITLYHFSNGHFQLPNLGVNFPAFQFGVKYDPSKENRFLQGDSTLKSEKKFRYTVKLGYGLHEFGTPTNPTGGPKYPTYHLSFYISKRYKPAAGYQLGMAAGYYTDFYDYIISEEVFDSHQRLKASTFMLIAGHEYFFGRVGIVTQLGIYVYNPFFKARIKMIGDDKKLEPQIKSYNSNRLSIQYYLLGRPEKTAAHNLFAGFGIKSNFGQADFVEWSLGYTF